MVLINWIKMALASLQKFLQPLIQPSSIYSREIPSHQLAVDLFAGNWTSKIPMNLKSGEVAIFEDKRPAWAEQVLGSFNQKKILELGPLEGAQTYLLEKSGAEITAIEGNKLAFQRCLIVKNILNMRSTFLLGDFSQYLQKTNEHFDLTFASGVLYHMMDPIQLLKDSCRISDQIFIWTHYYDADSINKNPIAVVPFKNGRTKTVNVGGKDIICFERSSVGFLVHLLPKFCGGMDRKTYWMKLDDIYWCLKTFGFEVVGTNDVVNAQHGPSISIAAKKIANANI